MRPRFDGCRVVGHDENSIVAVCLDRLMDRPDDMLVDEFDGGFLLLGVSAVAGFVGRFDVDEDDVVILQRLDCRRGFTLVVRVEILNCLVG